MGEGLFILYAAYAVAAVGAVAGAVQTRKTGKFQEKMAKKQAADEETEARERELQRKKKINKVLAAQIAGLGASGITAEGSPQLIATESLREESLAGLADVATRSGRERNLLAQGRAARKLGNLSAATNLISSAASIGIGYANSPT